jgi:hypothetical protein
MLRLGCSLALTLLLVVDSLVGGAAELSDFRIDSRIYLEPRPEPLARNTTIFSGDKVYDFALEEPFEAAIFQTSSQLFVLLDESRQMQTHLSGDELLKFTAALQVRAQGASPLARFAAQPELPVTWDASAQQLVLSSPLWTYTVQTQPAPSAAAGGRYRLFADWYARLNTTHPGALPPGPRLLLNAALLERHVLPLEIRRAITLSGQAPTVTRSQHDYHWQLTRDDRQRLQRADQHQARFERVDLPTYLQPMIAAGRSSAR